MRHSFLMTGFIAALLCSTAVLADDDQAGRLSLTDGIILNKEKTDTRDITEESLQNTMQEAENQNIFDDEDEDENKGFLSFLKFSFADKKEHKAVTPEKNETVEDFFTRVNHQADAGDVNALMTLGYMYLYGLNGVEMNYKKAFEYYQKAADKGDHVAINNLASLYYGGVGVSKNIEKAAELFAKASDMGNIEASLNLAVIYLTNQGSLRNEKAAAVLLKKVAEHNNPTGKYLLGYAYLKGIGVPQNKRKAVENIRFAADKGYDEAQYIMGHLYVQGWGVPQNYNNALKYLNRAANQGNLSAIQSLGNLYASSSRIEPNYYKAYIMYNLATFYGVPDAAEKRDLLATKTLKKPEVLQAQTEAENFKPSPSELTKYIRLTFGKSLAVYVDKGAPVIQADNE
ncbi:MAG: sel1 repeat family protein [Alphaproteobacteria bacterium]|nr:sel1 repeat family protein [Alphaproteobacteria bacterium]